MKVLSLLFSIFWSIILYDFDVTAIGKAATTNNAHKLSCDVGIIGAGIGGLTCAALLSKIYNLKVNVYESHYYVGGCAHSFPIKSARSKYNYMFDAGPTILLGCSRPPFNPLQEIFTVLDIQDKINWLPYNSWGMHTPEGGSWNFELGPLCFENGPLARFGGPTAQAEFRKLLKDCIRLRKASSGISSMAFRGDQFRIFPLLTQFQNLMELIKCSAELEGTFEPMLGTVKDVWLRNWLDALAFSLSGLPAASTGAAAMAFTLADLHGESSCLDYPEGGMGVVAQALRETIEESGGYVYVSTPVKR